MLRLSSKLNQYGPMIRYSKVIYGTFGLETIEDFLHFYPLRHIDLSNFRKVASLRPNDKEVQVIGTLESIEVEGIDSKMRLTAILNDDSINLKYSRITGKQYGFESPPLRLVWFRNIKWIAKTLEEGKEYVAFGKLTWFHGMPSLVHPTLDIHSRYSLKNKNTIKPIYPWSSKFSNMGLTKEYWIYCVKNLFNIPTIEIVESLPDYIRNRYQLLSKEDAVKNIHFPHRWDYIEKAKDRLKFEETFFMQIRMRYNNKKRKQLKNGLLFNRVGKHFNEFYHNKLDFKLTGAQKRVIKEIREDFRGGYQMNRLLQGDVGSGKTIVALATGLLAIDNDFQVALIAPTEILANQHYRTFIQYLPQEIQNCHLLTGNTPPSMRKIILDEIENGDAWILIGTHAILEDRVKFKKLGLVIIDEQHRFGVEQRAKLWDKNAENLKQPHILLMSATPIPRSLAHSYYGDLDMSKIDEMPKGRKIIKTIHYKQNQRELLYDFITDQIKNKRQIFIVYPLIEESENFDMLYLEKGYSQMKSRFEHLNYTVEMLHGKMKPEQKAAVMNRFKQGQLDILLSTTVIEVGVDIPNATVMVIENAERFGLSQLHQLRGRVGRGNSQGHCILVTGKKLTYDAKERIKIMVKTNDGFKIAEKDLEIRGQGDLIGTRQSGRMMYRLPESYDLDLIADQQQSAESILFIDPELTSEVHKEIKRELKRLPKLERLWSK